MKIDRKKLEIGVLVLGVIIIATAAILTFVNSNPGNIFYTNLIFSFGFLTYIVYSILNTASLNRLNSSLRSDLEEKQKTIDHQKSELGQKEKRIQELQKENTEVKEQLQSTKKELAELQSQEDQTNNRPD